ncbi:MAG: hypothetical protein ACYC8W_07545 [Candidatus Tyrphobacter sp.]
MALPASPSVTQKLYDGEDRLIEVINPRDSLSFAPSGTAQTDDLYSNPWITRYIYDLSENGNPSRGGSPTFDNQPITAHGNLYETQEYLPPLSGGTTMTETQSGATPAPIANTQFQETKGTAYDAIDRATALLRYQAGGTGQLSQQTMTYDAANDSVGMLTEQCNALTQCATLNYDPRGQVTQVTFTTPNNNPSCGTLNPGPCDGNTYYRQATYDADGRTATITSSTFGTQYYGYDADGNLTTSQEPNQGGVSSPATLTYHYYADDSRASLDVSSTGLSQTGLFQYAYRTDGTLKQLVVEDDANAMVGKITVAYTRDNAGNVLQRTESGGGGTPQSSAGCDGSPCQTSLIAAMDRTTYTYDNPPSGDPSGSGMLGSVTFAQDNPQYPGAESFAYNLFYSHGDFDPQGNLLGGSETHNGPTPTTSYQTHEVDSNGRLAGTANGAGPSVDYANGMMIQSGSGVTETWDARNGVATSVGTSSSTNTFSFDAAGRLNEEQIGSATMGATYDPENHLLSESWNNGSASSYQWGPNGHPITVGSISSGGTFQYDTLHWDGDSLLFTTNAQGQVDDIKVGDIGDITPLDSGFSGLTLTDRDISGTAIACHNATGSAGNGVDAPWRWYRFESEPAAYTSACSMQGANAPSWSIPWTEYPGSVVWTQEAPSELSKIAQVGHGGVLGMPRADGYTDGFTTFQGVRTYDGNAGVWMEPDAYGGVVNDPSSQQSYAYNGDDPIMYMDMTGMYKVIARERINAPPQTLTSQFCNDPEACAFLSMLSSIMSGPDFEPFIIDIPGRGKIQIGCGSKLGCFDNPNNRCFQDKQALGNLLRPSPATTASAADGETTDAPDNQFTNPAGGSMASARGQASGNAIGQIEFWGSLISDSLHPPENFNTVVAQAEKAIIGACPASDFSH